MAFGTFALTAFCFSDPRKCKEGSSSTCLMSSVAQTRHYLLHPKLLHEPVVWLLAPLKKKGDPEL